MADLNPYTDRPVFAAFLIDASSSMSSYVDAVIDGHRSMLTTLRQSEKCENGVLYIYQALFADQSILLNGFYPLDKDGNDEIVRLSQANYRPDGWTALYDAVVEMAEQLERHLEAVVKRGYLPAARLAVITDGAENKSKNSREQVVSAIRKLREKEWLESSLVVGLKSPDFGEDKIELLRQSIGFSQQISLDRNPQQIRRAFVLASRFKPDKN